jgi:hypothetical protein
MTVELALFIASKLASALDYAHRKKDFEEKEMGLVHRDVSPQNVLVSQEGDIKLCDFGIAKAASKASHTQAGALKGKLQYMSPEQAWGRTSTAARTSSRWPRCCSRCSRIASSSPATTSSPSSSRCARRACSRRRLQRRSHAGDRQDRHQGAAEGSGQSLSDRRRDGARSRRSALQLPPHADQRGSRDLHASPVESGARVR